MINHKLRKRLVTTVTVGAAAAIATLSLGAGIASASPSDPPGGATPVYPQFYNGQVEGIRNSGSDTTIFMMQTISDLYTASGLYGCVLNNTAGQTTYNPNDQANSNAGTFLNYYCQQNANQPTTDTVDNWDRTEVTTGVDEVGSSGGQAQLCGEADGTAQPDSPLPLDFSRSSKPADSLPGCSMQEVGYAKDGAPAVDFPTVNPGTTGSGVSAYLPNVNGGTGKIGEVVNGWLPGDSVTGPYSGTPFVNINNGGGTSDPSSVAYRLWCTHTNQITDWGQLTDLGPNVVVDQVTASTTSNTLTLPAGETFASTIGAGDTLTSTNVSGLAGLTVTANGGTSLTLSGDPGTTTTTGTITVATGTTAAVGSGQAIGVPVRVVGENPLSGTEATFGKFAASGTGSCNPDSNGATDPNPATATGDNAGAQNLLENNASNIGQTAVAYWPGDPADQALMVATSLYYESDGVYNTNPHAGAVTVNGLQYSAAKMELNSAFPSPANKGNNTYATARTLFNIINTATVRAPTAGFMNWICDSNNQFTKATDLGTGLNLDQELGNIISGQYGFTRLTDSISTTPSLVPADNQPAPNDTCTAGANVATTSGSNSITGTFPSSIAVGWTVVGTGIPAGTTVTANLGTSLTLSNAATATGTPAITFPGHPPVLGFVNG